MTYSASFARLNPGPRSNGEPWTRVRIRFSETSLSGPFIVIDTQPLDPVDTDPTAPQLRSLTTDTVPAPAGWFTFSFLDAEDDEGPASDPIYWPAAVSSPTTFASPADISARLGRELTDSETTQVAILLELTTGLIAEAANADQAWVDALLAEDAADAPLTYRLICIEAVLRGLQNPQGLDSQTETLGAYSHTERWAAASAAGLLLTVEEERRIRRAARGNRFQAVTLESPYSGTAADDQPELLL